MVINNDLPAISIINYGINNLKSVCMAFFKIGKKYQIIEKPEEVLQAKTLVLPGIGAFGDGIEGLRKRGLIDPIKQKVRNGTPMLGICLGMQLLFTESEEFGLHSGLDLISGRVVPFKPPNEISIRGYKVPHMGWNELKKPYNEKGNIESIWNDTILADIKIGTDVFFVHSYLPVPENKENIIATTIHGNQEFCSVVKKKNVYGTQFHPEKSGKVGLQILNTFCKLFNI